jgi:hypothetical protein
MKTVIMQFSPSACHFLPLMFKYSPHDPVPKHPQVCSSFRALRDKCDTVLPVQGYGTPHGADR